jgi:hypothetical protein
VNKYIIKANEETFMVLFENTGSSDYNASWKGLVLEIHLFTDESWEYRSKDSSDLTEDVDQARVLFEWSFCWRGVWEGRIYFKDDEYWSSEIKTISDIWDVIEAKFKEQIINDNPEYSHFDS